MIFKKKRGMIDVRELQKRGVVRIPKKDVVVPTDEDGFIEFGQRKKTTSETQSTKSNMEMFGFSSTTTSPTETFQTETDGYNKREVDEKITGLDNKIYKLENRIELLEKKLDIEKPADTNVGVMGW